MIDTEVFAENRYFDLFVKYAKQSPEDILVHIQVINHSSEVSVLHLLLTLWFYNIWLQNAGHPKPVLKFIK